MHHRRVVEEERLNMAFTIRVSIEDGPVKFYEEVHRVSDLTFPWEFPLREPLVDEGMVLYGYTLAPRFKFKTGKGPEAAAEVPPARGHGDGEADHGLRPGEVRVPGA